MFNIVMNQVASLKNDDLLVALREKVTQKNVGCLLFAYNTICTLTPLTEHVCYKETNSAGDKINYLGEEMKGIGVADNCENIFDLNCPLAHSDGMAGGMNSGSGMNEQGGEITSCNSAGCSSCTPCSQQWTAASLTTHRSANCPDNYDETCCQCINMEINQLQGRRQLRRSLLVMGEKEGFVEYTGNGRRLDEHCMGKKAGLTVEEVSPLCDACFAMPCHCDMTRTFTSLEEVSDCNEGAPSGEGNNNNEGSMQNMNNG